MKCVLTWLEQSAAQKPQHCAVSDPHLSLTYEELLHAAQSFGTYFATADHAAARRSVAFYLEKSSYALAAMLGAVYAGDYYSVLDTRQPAVRIHEICQTLNPQVIVTDDEFYEQALAHIDTNRYQVVRLSEILHTAINTDFLAACQRALCDIDPLYVNFTSGSTGKPKGVVVSHRSVIDFIPIFTSTFHMDSDDIFANQAPFDFDVSVKDIYSALYLGATLQIIPREYFSVPTKLMDYLVEQKVTTLVWAVSALCFVSIMNGFDYKVPTTIKRVLFSGEVMPIKQLAKWRKYLPDVTYVNLYGPTEITCNCTYFVVDRPYQKGEVIPIGKPFDNERVVLIASCDENEDKACAVADEGALNDGKTCEYQVTKAGVEGEICVSGTALGLGYLNEPQKTAAAFVQNPLQNSWLEPLYRTGDMGYFDSCGNLVYTSRKDHQIKHLGHRIELGDIEAAAMNIDGVEQAVCTYDSKRHRLHLFYMGTALHSDVADALHQNLPQFMIPNTLEALEKLPLTKNGKVDRQALMKK